MQYDLEETAGYLIYRVGRLLRFRAAQFFREHGEAISPEQWGMLLRIAELGNPSVGELVDGVMNDHPNVTRMVDGLKRLGYVTKLRNPKDSRSRLVTVTAEGKALADRVLPELVARKYEYFRDLDQNDVSDLNRSLKRVLARLEK